MYDICLGMTKMSKKFFEQITNNFASNGNAQIHHCAAKNSFLDFVTSIIASMLIFSILGELSLKLEKPIKDVVKGGTGLAFVVYPEAISLLPLPQLWYGPR